MIDYLPRLYQRAACGMVYMAFLAGCTTLNQIPSRHGATDGSPTQLLVEEAALNQLELALRLCESGRQLSEFDDPRSIDHYFRAAVLSWNVMTASGDSQSHWQTVWSTYHASVAGLVSDAVRFGRLEAGHVRGDVADGMLDLPIVANKLPLAPCEVDELRVVADHEPRNLKRVYAQQGLGVTALAIRKQRTIQVDYPASVLEQFFPPCLPVATTVVLRPAEDSDVTDLPLRKAGFVLALENPLTTRTVTVGRYEQALASNLSAPLQLLQSARPTPPLTGFLLPGSSTRDDGLKWLEPYQPGKIPVVLVHGLLSDPSTWMDLVNDLRTQDWFNANYQVWGFSYATGSPFVASAQKLREQLREIRFAVDPRSQDAALDQMVLVGHSMGGLVAKLQVVESGDQMWDSVSRVPLDTIRASPTVRSNLRESLYFSPSTSITRVVYIATPHEGSSFASRGIGRLSSALVRSDEVQKARHQRLIDDNPHAFIGTFQKRVPTSIDLLEPSNCTLRAIYGLAVPDHITQHTIAGTGKGLRSLTSSDGVVSIESASHPACVSFHHVPEIHTDITRAPETIVEISRILQLHLKQVAAMSPGDPAFCAEQPDLSRFVRP